MPIVEVTLFEGRSEEMKAAMASEIAAAVGEYTVNSIDDVHVIFHEKSREQWARGTNWVAKSGGGSEPRKRAEAASVSRIEYTPDTEEEYLRWRRDILHPAMATMPGYVSGKLWRLQDRTEYFLVLEWMTRDDIVNYFESELHEELRQRAMELLPKPLDTFIADRVHLFDPE